MLDAQQLDARTTRDFRGAVGRAIIDNDDLAVGIIHPLERVEAGAQGRLRIVSRDHH